MSDHEKPLSSEAAALAAKSVVGFSVLALALVGAAGPALGFAPSPLIEAVVAGLGGIVGLLLAYRA